MQIRDFTRRVQLLPRIEGAAGDRMARSAVSPLTSFSLDPLTTVSDACAAVPGPAT